MSAGRIIIVGGGAAGLSTAGALKQRGLNAIVLDRLPRIGDVWARRYDRLRLHTVLSSLAHYPLPRRYPRYPSKDQYARYLRDYAQHFAIDIVAGCPVQRIRLEGDHAQPNWVVESACGAWPCRIVVLATGQYAVPHLPDWPGATDYRGSLVHAASFTSGRQYAGKRVLVIGIGNTGAEIATDLVEQGAAAVSISVRTPPPIVARDPFGLPAQRSSLVLWHLAPSLADRIARGITRLVVGDLRPFGLPAPAWWPYSTGNVPVIDVGFVEVLKQGRIAVRPDVDRFTTEGVAFIDGEVQPFDVVIAATGYRTGLEQLLALPDLLDATGNPRFPSAGPTRYPGLYFMGFGQSLRGLLWETQRASQRLATVIAQEIA
ncbi:MAG: NAD(P)/FAD-dependent oxidoreductase [Herpetosiphon sp.]